MWKWLEAKSYVPTIGKTNERKGFEFFWIMALIAVIIESLFGTFQITALFFFVIGNWYFNLEADRLGWKGWS